ncbi:hypothetical protein GHT06_015734 [Daphnia sinensis]|uniref:Uncharacterized protein n=1 Tax=Daphnia sinensis TaxID=1820382 RepID=A0AAD5PWF6_9CRUS|nr:hypothetical protein GHT06_015734 [Daphnia sinensis]
MLHNFFLDICGLPGGFTLEKREQQCVDCIRCSVGHDEIVLMQQAADLTFYDASINISGRQPLLLHRTVKTLEEKRRVIGDTFVRMAKEADRTTNDLNLTWKNLLLGKGTLRPDSGEPTSHMSSRANAMKTYSDDSEMVRQLRLHDRVVDPIKEFHKK